MVATLLERMLGELLAGKFPDPWKRLLRAGAPGVLPLEEEDKRKAVLYAVAAKSGEILDRSYNKTIRENFNVGDSTVRKWMRDYPENLDGFFPNASKNTRAELIESQMKAAGKRFFVAGRSHKAIARRGMSGDTKTPKVIKG